MDLALPEGIHVIPPLTLSRVDASIPDTRGYRTINLFQTISNTYNNQFSLSTPSHHLRVGFVFLLMFVILSIVGEVRAAKILYHVTAIGEWQFITLLDLRLTFNFLSIHVIR